MTSQSTILKKELTKELALVKELAIRAGIVALQQQKKGLTVYKKKDKSPVTNGDFAANKIIVEGIKKYFPNDAILSEESVDDDSRLKKKRVWVIDPIDGTRNYLVGGVEYSVNIALVENHRPILGVIYLPAKKIVYYAIAESELHAGFLGAFKDSIGRNGAVRTHTIHTSSITRVVESTVLTSRYLDSTTKYFLKKNSFKKVLHVNSSIKACLVAEGKADSYIRFTPFSEWDVCASDCIVTAAGGQVSNLAGKPLHYNKKNTLVKGVMLTNALLHKKILGLLQK